MANAKGAEASKKRYEPLGDYLRVLDAGISEVSLSFADVERIIGCELPPSATKHHSQWWANQTHGSRAPHWNAAGFRVRGVNLPQRLVRFERVAAPLGLTLTDPGLQEIVSAINDHARGRPIGTLQDWRKTHYGLSRSASRTPFYSQIDPDRSWAFHVGGLSELQFNVGIEKVNDPYSFRHGVAFSLQPTRELPDITPLIPKVARFNEYIRIYPNVLEGFSMWHFQNGVRSTTYTAAQIADELLVPSTFIFIGVLQPADAVRIDWILDDFDRLLPLYKYVEGRQAFPNSERARKGFQWSPGNRARATRTSHERAAWSVDKSLRHNILQDALFKHLEEKHGPDNTSGEQNCGNGTPVDIAVRDCKGFTYYEIKTGLSAQSCIREALGQLLEYAYWPGAQKAERLVIVGEPKYDSMAKAYIKRLRKDFSLPIEYERFDMKSRRLI